MLNLEFPMGNKFAICYFFIKYKCPHKLVPFKQWNSQRGIWLKYHDLWFSEPDYHRHMVEIAVSDEPLHFRPHMFGMKQ